MHYNKKNCKAKAIIDMPPPYYSKADLFFFSISWSPLPLTPLPGKDNLSNRPEPDVLGSEAPVTSLPISGPIHGTNAWKRVYKNRKRPIPFIQGLAISLPSDKLSSVPPPNKQASTVADHPQSLPLRNRIQLRLNQSISSTAKASHSSSYSAFHPGPEASEWATKRRN